MNLVAGIIIFVVVLIGGIASQPKTTNIQAPSTISIIPKKNTPTIIKTTITTKELYQVTKIIDGDTIDIDINGKMERIRLIGIDTPEIVDPRKPVQCFGIEASKKAKEVLSNKKVLIESDPTQGDKDKYGRLLRYIFLEDGTSLNKTMILEGFAHEYTYKTPYKYQSEYKEAEKKSREGGKGLWADNVCVTPTPTNVPKPTSLPTNIPTIYILPTSVPQIPIYIPATQVPQVNTGGGYSCNCSKTCGAMESCDEAYYQLNNCGCSVRDGDHDGVPCESICSGG